MPLRISKPKGSPHFPSGFKAVSLAIVAWPRTGQTPYCSGSLLAQPSGSNSRHLICFTLSAYLLYQVCPLLFWPSWEKKFLPKDQGPKPRRAAFLQAQGFVSKNGKTCTNPKIRTYKMTAVCANAEPGSTVPGCPVAGTY